MSAEVLAADLGREHHGWLVEFDVPPSPDSAPGIGRRQILLGGVRIWDHEGRTRAGLLDISDTTRWYGTEHHMPGDRSVSLVRQLKRGVRRAAARDYRDLRETDR